MLRFIPVDHPNDVIGMAGLELNSSICAVNPVEEQAFYAYTARCSLTMYGSKDSKIEVPCLKENIWTFSLVP